MVLKGMCGMEESRELASTGWPLNRCTCMLYLLSELHKLLMLTAEYILRSWLSSDTVASVAVISYISKMSAQNSDMICDSSYAPRDI